MSRDHESLAESTGAYVLGALPELEATAFEHHVMGCAACRDEVERLGRAVDALPRSVQPRNAPASLRRSLLEVVDREAGDGRETAFARVSRRLRPARPARPRVAWASAALALLIGMLMGVGAASLLDDDGGRKLAATVDESRLADASASLLLPSPEDEEGHPTLSVHGMPPLPSRDSNRVYQLWLVRGNEVIPSAVFSVRADGSGAAAIPDGLDDVDAIWVTRERPGGARSPSEPPVMRVKLS